MVDPVGVEILVAREQLGGADVAVLDALAALLAEVVPVEAVVRVGRRRLTAFARRDHALEGVEPVLGVVRGARCVDLLERSEAVVLEWYFDRSVALVATPVRLSSE